MVPRWRLHGSDRLSESNKITLNRGSTNRERSKSMIDKFLQTYFKVSITPNVYERSISFTFRNFRLFFFHIRIDSYRFNTLQRHYAFDCKDINPEMIILLYISRLVYRYPPTCSPRHSLETLQLAGSKSRKGARLPQSYVSRIQYRMKIATLFEAIKKESSAENCIIVQVCIVR